ncbi:hypothetical protein V2J56_05600 [Georgenia sp. MJ206]|uniref:hypothetical protein n=1 Tax=Georgenia wangjunii TaxID=3117730 RepID=UPI002F267ADE
MTAVPETPAAVGRHPRHVRGRSPLLDVVTDLLADVEAVRFPLDLSDAPELRRLRERVETQIGAHLLPRLKHEEGPAVVVVGGSTGAGKSTLVNSVITSEVSTAGVLRPTTTQPVLAARPEDSWLLEDHPLAALADLVEDDGVPRGLALLDTPDVDSVDETNRRLADVLLETADLWVFVTTASRYGDAVPWRILTQAQERGTSLAVVLNRVPRRVLAEVRADLLGRLDGLGLGSAPLFVIEDVGPHEGLLPESAIEPLRTWLTLVGGRNTARGVVRRTTQGAWHGLREDLLRLADGVTAQTIAAGSLRSRAAHAAEDHAEAFTRSLAAGVAAQGAPTTRWLSLASTGGPLAPLVAGTGSRVRRGWRSGAYRTRSAAAAEIAADVRAALVTLIAAAAGEAGAAVRAAGSAPALGGQVPLAASAGVTAPGTAAATGAPGTAGATSTSADAPGTDAAARQARARSAVDRWVARTKVLTPELAAGSARDALDHAGVAALAQAGAAGLDGAARALSSLLGRSGVELVERARAELIEYAGAAVRAEADRFVERLDELDLRPEAGSGLRLRASELRGHL